MQTYKRAITPPQSCIVLFLILCFWLRIHPSPSLSVSVSGLPFSLLSISLGWSLFLPSCSFLILFISHRVGPQRHSVELSDLNKCLRLEPRLSCGLGCQCGSWCSSHSVVPRRLNESLSKPPPSSVCHFQFVASIFNGLGDVRKAPASISVWINKIVEDGYCFPITVAFILMQIQCENVWDIIQFA